MGLFHRQAHRIAQLTSLLFGCALSVLSYSAPPREASEEDIRAALVHHLLSYSESKYLGNPQTTICSIGHDDKTRLALERLENEPIAKKSKLSVLHYSSDTQKKCHIVIVGPHLKFPLVNIASHPYIICNGCSIENKAAVSLVRLKDKIGYNINLSAAKISGVRFRSDVLKWANKIEH